MYQFFSMPSQNYFGEGCINSIIDKIIQKQLKQCLIVTDDFIYKSDIFKWVINALYKAGADWVVYKDTQPNPTDRNVYDAYDKLIEYKCDFILSLGGGSSHDCAKGVGILATNGGKISDYEGGNKLLHPILPLIAINTTAGTASEMTYFCIITDEERHVKMAIIDPKVTPWLSVNDPLTMVSKPPKLTAATGLDALTHAIEAYVSTQATPITDACAIGAIKLVTKFLPIAVKNGSNVEARQQMTYAQFMAGMAFNNASLGYVHAIAHQLGGLYNLPHGICNAVLLPYVLKFNSDEVGDRLIDIANVMEIEEVNTFNAKDKVFKALLKLNEILDIPIRLKALGVERKDFQTIATNALKDPCGNTNPIQTDLSGIISILEEAYD